MGRTDLSAMAAVHPLLVCSVAFGCRYWRGKMDLNSQKILVISEQPTLSRIELRHLALNFLVQVQK
jgi:hypothetical protein